MALAGFAVAGLTMISPEAARAGLYSLNTGISTTPTGGPDSALDNLWNVSYSYPAGNPVTTVAAMVVGQGGFPFGYWMDNTAYSSWVTPSSFDRNNAPPPRDQPPVTFAYYTTFNLSTATAAVATLSGRWSSDNNTVLVKLNGTTIFSGDTGYEPYRYWTSLSVAQGVGFKAGLNTLVFDVVNQPQDSGNPTGFRFEGAVAVPEPSTLLAGFVGAALFCVHALRIRRKALAA